MNIEDTIDAFVDGITVDPNALDAALASADGRAYLLDVLALRGLMRDEPVASAPVKRMHTWFVVRLTRAAALALAFAGLGYLAGTRSAVEAPSLEISSAQSATPPEPTRVIELTPGVTWHESKGGD